MHKFIYIFVCLILCSPAFSAEYRVIKIIDGDTIYLDFNKNGKPDQEERVRLNGIDAFELHPSQHLKHQMREFGLSELQILTLGFLGKEFAKQELLNKKVTAEYTAETAVDKYGRSIMSVKYDNNKSYEKEILQAGLAIVYQKSNLAPDLSRYENISKIFNNAKSYKEFKLMYYNYRNNKYYPISSIESYRKTF